MTLQDIGNKLMDTSTLFIKGGLTLAAYSQMRNNSCCCGPSVFGSRNGMGAAYAALGFQQGLSNGSYYPMGRGGNGNDIIDFNGGGYSNYNYGNSSYNFGNSNYNYGNSSYSYGYGNVADPSQNVYQTLQSMQSEFGNYASQQYQHIVTQGESQTGTTAGSNLNTNITNGKDSIVSTKKQSEDKNNYIDAFKKAGQSFSAFIDNAFGKKDGKGVDKDDWNAFLDSHKIDKSKADFKKFDKDNNGKIDENEMANVLYAMDADHDGKITTKEVTDWASSPSASTLPAEEKPDPATDS